MGELRNQIYAAICVNFGVFAYAFAFGWPTPNIILLQSDDTPLPYGPLTQQEMSFLMSISSIGAFSSLFVFGWLSDTIGRKWSMFACGPIMSVSWTLVAIGTNPIYLYVHRYLIGFATGGLGLLVPLFMSEISDDKIRGLLLAAPYLVGQLSALTAYIGGEFLAYYSNPYIGIIPSVIFVVSLPFFPRTPMFLLKKGKYVEAEESMKFYKGLNSKGKNIVNELDCLTQIQQLRDSDELKEKEKITLNDVFSRYAMKSFFYSFILYQVTCLSGLYVIVDFVAVIFKESGSKLSPNLNSIVVGCIIVSAAFLGTFLIEKVGRKILLVISGLGCGLCYTILGIYFYMKHINYDISYVNWIPLVFISALMFAAQMGMTGVTICVTYEILPPKVRSAFSCILNGTMCIALFVIYKYFSYLMDVIHIHGCVWMFASVCYFTVLFVIICLPETKGKSFEQISEEMK